jgi:hypothetical protein
MGVRVWGGGYPLLQPLSICIARANFIEQNGFFPLLFWRSNSLYMSMCINSELQRCICHKKVFFVTYFGIQQCVFTVILMVAPNCQYSEDLSFIVMFCGYHGTWVRVPTANKSLQRSVSLTLLVRKSALNCGFKKIFSIRTIFVWSARIIYKKSFRWLHCFIHCGQTGIRGGSCNPSYWEVDIWGWSEVGWLRPVRTWNDHLMSALGYPLFILTNVRSNHHQISMRCTWPISALNSIGCGFEPGWCPKNAALEKTCAWHDGLFQIRMVAIQISVWIARWGKWPFLRQIKNGHFGL